MNLAREILLCIEAYKTLNILNPCFMQELFKLRETNKNVRNKYKLNLNIFVVNQVNYGMVLKESDVLDLKYGTLYHTT